MSAEIVLFHAPQSCSRLPLRCDVVAFPRERVFRLVMETPVNPMWEMYLAWCGIWFAN